MNGNTFEGRLRLGLNAGLEFELDVLLTIWMSMDARGIVRVSNSVQEYSTPAHSSSVVNVYPTTVFTNLTVTFYHTVVLAHILSLNHAPTRRGPRLRLRFVCRVW